MNPGRIPRASLRGLATLCLVIVFALSLGAPSVARIPAGPPALVTGFLLHSEFTPDDPMYRIGPQWGLPFIEVPKAWDVTLGSHSVVVAVVDTGVWYTGTDLAPNMWNNTDGSHGWDFINNDNTPLDGDVGEYHGTAVSGVIGAVINNNDAVAGVADISIMALRALGPKGEGTSTNTSAAIRWAANNGARIINLSLGTNNTFGTTPTDISLAVNYAWNKGALIVAAAGNSASGALDYPAALPNVVSVAAVDNTGTRAPFSNYGPGLSISAPGVDIWTLSAGNQAQQPTQALSGTSLSTPFVSGVAALLLSMDSSLTNVELWNILNETATPRGAGYNTNYGWGIVDAWNALNLLKLPFISVNSYPTTVSHSSPFSVGWSIHTPVGSQPLPVSDTHVIWGTNQNSLGNATAAQSGVTGVAYSASGLSIPGSANTLYFKVTAMVNGTRYESPLETVNASSLPDFLFVLIGLLSSNLLFLALFILALAAIIAFVPQRRARSRRAQARQRQVVQTYQAPPAQGYGPPPAGPPAASTSFQTKSVAEPAPIEFVRPAAPPPAAVAPTPPPAPVATKKRCPNCGTLVNADNQFCFFCGNPFR